jgi:hypothetical protein
MTATPFWLESVFVDFWAVELEEDGCGVGNDDFGVDAGYDAVVDTAIYGSSTLLRRDLYCVFAYEPVDGGLRKSAQVQYWQ